MCCNYIYTCVPVSHTGQVWRTCMRYVLQLCLPVRTCITYRTDMTYVYAICVAIMFTSAYLYHIQDSYDVHVRDMCCNYIYRCILVTGIAYMLDVLRTSFCYYLCQGGYVMTGVCLFVILSVCLLSTLCKNYWTDPRENFTTDVLVDKEELIKFWKSSASGSGSRNYLKDSLKQCEIGHFYTIWLTSLERVIQFSRKFYYRCILGQGGPH